MSHLVLFCASMVDDLTTEVDLAGVTPTLCVRPPPPAGRHTHTVLIMVDLTSGHESADVLLGLTEPALNWFVR